MKIGIVGGSGFIGQQLYLGIKKQNNIDVKVFDITCADSILKEDFIYLDVTKTETIKEAFKGFQVVYYKTGLMGPGPSFESPLLFYKLNLEGCLKVLEECIESGVEQFVYDSTESVFGINDKAPFHEDQMPTPSSIYGATKTICEQYLKYAAAVNDIETAAFRYPRIISPENHHVFKVISQKVRDNDEIEVTSNGRKHFDVVHINDVIKWNMWFIKNRGSAILHVTAGFKTSVVDIINAFHKRISGKPVYDKIRYNTVETNNDRLLSDSTLLDNKESLAFTGYDIEYKQLVDFISLF